MVQGLVMQDALWLSPIGPSKSRRMVLAAPQDTTAVQPMITVSVLIVLTFEQLLKVSLQFAYISALLTLLYLVPGWSFKNGHFLSGLISEDRTAYKDLTEAMKSCKKYGSCKGVTHDVRRKVYELRAGKQFIKSSTGERSWLKV